MLDGYPVCAGGLNLFTIYGTHSRFMNDQSAKVPVHEVWGNQWYPSPPPQTAFWPADLSKWKYLPTATHGECDEPKGGSSNAAQLLFEQGYTAEMAGNPSAAQSAYTQVISQYPDSTWAQVAAVRLLTTQQQVDSAYSTLGNYYQSIVSAVPARHLLDRDRSGSCESDACGRPTI